MFPSLITRLRALRICRQISTLLRRTLGNRELKFIVFRLFELQVCLPKLRDLNPYVNVTRREEEITEDFLKTFRVCRCAPSLNA